jgi:SAM-dependent methyltransferase
MLEVAMHTPGIEWLTGSALALPLPDAAFDVVLCQQGMQFFKDREAAARELRRVCRGRAVVACWQGVEQQSFFAAVVRSQAKHLGATIEDAGKPFTFGDGAALGAVLRDAGFARVDVQAHTVEARFPNPPQFIRMCVASALAVMPERFGSVDPEPFIAAVVADVQDEMRRFTVGDQLLFTMMTNTAVAFV